MPHRRVIAAGLLILLTIAFYWYYIELDTPNDPVLENFMNDYVIIFAVSVTGVLFFLVFVFSTFLVKIIVVCGKNGIKPHCISILFYILSLVFSAIAMIAIYFIGPSRVTDYSLPGTWMFNISLFISLVFDVVDLVMIDMARSSSVQHV